MRRVLITGANSYVGTNVEKWLMREPDKYYVETLDMKDPNWKEFDFSKFDVVFHVAGIAHISTKKHMKNLYFKINCDLAISVANEAKNSGVKHFIFMSSMIVYSSKETEITLDTTPKPDNFYGLSKLEAEKGIKLLQNNEFKVCILRPPMIYGYGSKGNFPKLIELTRKIIIFPNIQNKRSMLYVDNLCESVKTIIELQFSGLVYPQNKEYSCTSDIIKQFALHYNKKIIFTRFFNPILFLLKRYVVVLNKLFSDSYYKMEMSRDIIHCSKISLFDSLIGLVKNE